MAARTVVLVALLLGAWATPVQAKPAAVVLVVDRSGSMSGAKIEAAKAAVGAARAALPKKSELAVVVFDTQPTLWVPLQPAANKKAIEDKIRTLYARGGTNIYPALAAAKDVIGKSKLARRHIILLSDGQSDYAGIEYLVEKMVKQKITVSTVAIGDADELLLRQIAGYGHGRFTLVEKVDDLSAVMVSEISTATRGGKAPPARR